MSLAKNTPSEKALAREAKRQEAIAAKAKYDEQVRTIMATLEGNPLIWFHYCFAHHIRKETPPFHVFLVRGVVNNRYLAVAAPRGSAKSTILAFLKPFHDIVFKKRRFILIISNTFKKAAMSLDTIKKEIQENQMIRDLHPGLEVYKDAEGDSEIRHPDGFTTKILCKGVDQLGSVRGVKFGAYRPDLVIGDDMEDDELVRSPERRVQLQQDFDDVLTPIGDSDTQFVFIGTILHDDSLLAKLVSKTYYPEYKKLLYKARYKRKGEPKSLWPAKWTVEELNQMEKDKPSVFAKEMQNDPASGANARFKKEDFRTWKLEPGNEYSLLNEHGEVISAGRLSDCVPAIACDLAWKEKRESDNCVIMPGFLTPNSEILIDDYVAGKGFKPTDVAEHLFIMADRLKRVTGQDPPIGFEKAMLENVTQWFLKQEMRKRNEYLITRELVWDADKITRIETRLLSRYAQHVIFHKRGMGDLEYQLLRHPTGTHDDLIDAEQGLVQLLQNPRRASQAPAPDDEFMTLRQMMIDRRTGKKPSGYQSPVQAQRSYQRG